MDAGKWQVYLLGVVPLSLGQHLGSHVPANRQCLSENSVLTSVQYLQTDNGDHTPLAHKTMALSIMDLLKSPKTSTARAPLRRQEEGEEPGRKKEPGEEEEDLGEEEGGRGKSRRRKRKERSS